MNRIFVGVCVMLASGSCSKTDKRSGQEPEKSTTSTADSIQAEAKAKNVSSSMSDKEGIAAAKTGAQKLGKALKIRLLAAMGDGGVDSALHACASEAQTLTENVGTQQLRVGRTSLRLRNQKNANAPEWVKSWLVKTGERKAAGVVGLEDAVDGTAHVLIPLQVGGICLSCHGDVASHSGEMKALLASQYPGDKATGYEVGDLRGVIWAEYDFKP